MQVGANARFEESRLTLLAERPKQSGERQINAAKPEGSRPMTLTLA